MDENLRQRIEDLEYQTSQLRSVFYNNRLQGGQIFIKDSEAGIQLFSNDVKNIKSYIAGETLIKGDAVFMETSAQAISIGGFSNDGGANTGFGGATGPQQQVAQRFTGIAGSISRITISLKKTNSPTDNVVVTLRSGSETGTALATASVDGSTLTTSYANYDFNLDSQVTLVSTTTYSIVLSRSGTYSDTNLYSVQRGTTGAVVADVTGGQPYYFDGSTWSSVASSNDFILTLKLVTVAGQVYKTTGGTAATSDGFIGFANDSIAQNVLGNIRVAGVVTGLSSLTIGAQYRCAATPRGSITTGGANRKVGVSNSATELTISNIW